MSQSEVGKDAGNSAVVNPDEESVPRTPVTVTVGPGNRILRSPSHESVTTDLSLFSVSSLASDGRRLVGFKGYGDPHVPRGPSPNPSRPADIPEVLWLEEETEVIRNCAALSSALGLQKSFSTTDISQLPSPDDHPMCLRPAVSDLALSVVQKYGYLVSGGGGRLDHASRSCSTWVAVGDPASQLPSPHGGGTTSVPPPPALSPADLVRSVNKKVRQNYIRRRLVTTYKALERLSQSQFNLDRLEAAAAAAVKTAGNRLEVPGAIRPASASRTSGASLTISDVERQRGKPLSKYDRNMMIFNWLHTLNDAAPEPVPPP